jgi:hypothetical protein
MRANWWALPGKHFGAMTPINFRNVPQIFPNSLDSERAPIGNSTLNLQDPRVQANPDPASTVQARMLGVMPTIGSVCASWGSLAKWNIVGMGADGTRGTGPIVEFFAVDTKGGLSQIIDSTCLKNLTLDSP